MRLTSVSVALQKPGSALNCGNSRVSLREELRQWQSSWEGHWTTWQKIWVCCITTTKLSFPEIMAELSPLPTAGTLIVNLHTSVSSLPLIQRIFILSLICQYYIYPVLLEVVITSLTPLSFCFTCCCHLNWFLCPLDESSRAPDKQCLCLVNLQWTWHLLHNQQLEVPQF